MITRRLKDALGLVDIRILDHLIIAGGEATSLAERGLLQPASVPLTESRRRFKASCAASSFDQLSLFWIPSPDLLAGYADEPIRGVHPSHFIKTSRAVWLDRAQLLPPRDVLYRCESERCGQ